MKKIFLTLALLATLTTVFAQNTSDAQDDPDFLRGLFLYQIEHDHESALLHFKKSAEKRGRSGAISMHYIGTMYLSGLGGLSANTEEALKWFKQSADNGYEEAASMIGDLYYEGKYIPKNISETIRWYKKASEGESASAAYNIGVIYYNGDDVARNYEEAINWFKVATDNGHEEAAFIIGRLYHHGEYISKDISEAIKWYVKASDLGHGEAAYNIAFFYFNGEGLSQDDTKATIWLIQAYRNGYQPAEKNLLSMYEDEGFSSENQDLREILSSWHDEYLYDTY